MASKTCCTNLDVFLTLNLFIRAGCFVGCIQRWQSSNRVRLTRQDHQIVEHSGRMQIHHPRWRPFRLGIVRSILTKPHQPNHRVMRLGSYRQSMELGQLQTQDQPQGTQWLLEHRYRFPRRFVVHIRWQRHQSFALGLERWQTFAHLGP